MVTSEDFFTPSSLSHENTDSLILDDAPRLEVAHCNDALNIPSSWDIARLSAGLVCRVTLRIPYPAYIAPTSSMRVRSKMTLLPSAYATHRPVHMKRNERQPRRLLTCPARAACGHPALVGGVALYDSVEFFLTNQCLCSVLQFAHFTPINSSCPTIAKHLTALINANLYNASLR